MTYPHEYPMFAKIFFQWLPFPGARDVGGHWDDPAAAAIQKSDFMLYIHRGV